MATVVERLYRLTVDGSQADRQLRQLNQTTSGIASGFNQMRSAAVSAFGVFAAARGLQTFVQAADKIELMTGSFEALTGSAERAADMTERVFNTIKSTGSDLDDTAESFKRLSIGLVELGATNAQIDAVASSFIKLGRISGSSMANTNSALVQFTQGLTSGALQGDELRSILERLPILTRLIADEYSRVNGGIEVSIGMIKKLGREGKLTSDILVNSLLANFDEINDKFGKLVFTLDQELSVFKLSLTRAFADVAVKFGIGDAVKASVREAASALEDFRRNLDGFTADVTKLNTFMKETTNGFLGVAEVIAIALVPALIKLTNAVRTFALLNPWTALISLLSIGVPIIIARWDLLKNFFLNEVPSWLFSLKGHFINLVIDVTGVTQRFVDSLKGYGVKTANFFLEFGNEIKAFYDRMEPDSAEQTPFMLLAMPEETINGMERFRDAADKAFADAKRKSDDYIAGIAASTEAVNAHADALELLGDANKINFGDPKDWEKANDEMMTFREQVLQTIDPLYKLGEQVVALHSLMALGLLSEDQVNTYLDMMDGTLEATEKAAEAAKNSALEWEKFGISVQDAVDPMAAVLRKFTEIDMAIEQGAITPELGEAFKKTMIDLDGQLITASDKILSALERIKQATDGFAREFTDTLVEGLKTGEYAFEDFAASILETMTKIVLNSIFEKFFAMLFASFNFGGASGGGGSFAGAPTRMTRAGEGGDSHSVGVMQSPTYGRGAAAGLDPVKVTVYNNAPVDVKTSSRNNESGGIDLDILIEQKVSRAITGGAFDKSMQSSYGLTRRAY